MDDVKNYDSRFYAWIWHGTRAKPANNWLQLKKSASFTTTSMEFINSDKITFERF